MAKNWFGAALFTCSGLLMACTQGPVGSPAPVMMSAPQRPSGPEPGPPHAVSVKGRSILVKPGQSLGGIAETYHVSTRAIVVANNLTPPYELKIGQRLVIPDTTARPTPANTTAPRRTRPALGVEDDEVKQPQRRPKRPPLEEIPLDDPPPLSSAPTSQESATQRAPTR